MRKELSACITEKFNGYKLLRNHLQFKERKNFIPIDVVHEPTLNDKETIECFYGPEISLGYYVTRDKLRNGQIRRDNLITAITFLLRVRKRWKKIYFAALEKLDLLIRLIMEK